jgi:hypothetical protein
MRWQLHCCACCCLGRCLLHLHSSMLSLRRCLLLHHRGQALHVAPQLNHIALQLSQFTSQAWHHGLPQLLHVLY